MRAAAIGALLGTLGGCAAPGYVEPTSEPRARVRFVGNNHATSVVRYYEREDCNDPKTIAALGRLIVVPLGSGKKLGMPQPPALPETTTTEVHLPAGKPVILGFSYSFARSSCGVIVSFEPVAGRDYEAQFTYDDAGCEAKILHLGATTRVRDVTARQVDCRRY